MSRVWMRMSRGRAIPCWMRRVVADWRRRGGVWVLTCWLVVLSCMVWRVEPVAPGSGVDGAESVVHSIAVAGDGGGESCGAGGAPSAAAEGVFFLRRRLLLVAVGGAAVVGAVLAARARALTSPACSPSSSAAGSTTAGGLRTGLRQDMGDMVPVTYADNRVDMGDTVPLTYVDNRGDR